MAVPTSWQEGRNSIVTTVSRKTAHRRISFLIVAVSAPERHWIRFQSHIARAAHATYSVGTVRSSGRMQSSGRTHIYIDRYIQARAWQYKFHQLTYRREARFARQLVVINPQRACVRVAVVTFIVCVCVCLSVYHKLILKMASFYLSKRASKHGRRLFKDFK